ncbi:MAG: gliding motility-associated C-terminal domain-containing protein, partial [Bacteroidia bacterium]|nr:gliding motility-associated C-terminal domain-containing protein [Bacteroidia bacterium]
WLWNFGDGTYADQRRPVKTYPSGSYRVELTTEDSLGCRDTFAATLRVEGQEPIAVPDAFTPNSDDVNGEFRVFARGLRDFRLTIYNRYGTAVFRTETPDFAWRGMDASGRPLPEGVYVYQMTAFDAQGYLRSRTGTLTLVR